MFRLDALQASHDVLRLPYTLRVLLENVLRMEDGVTVTSADVEAVAGWVAAEEPSREISFTPGRVLLQDFTGVPAVVDLAAMRNAMSDLGGEARRINPLLPVELVIDHSVQVDEFASKRRDLPERRARVPAEPRALRVPALGAGSVRRFQGRAAEHRDRPPGEPRVPRARRRRARRCRLSRHARRDGLAHDHDQRARRPRLGSRRDRGRGRHARRGDLHARPAGRRLPPDGCAARRRRRPPTSCSRSRRSSEGRASSASSSSTSATAWRPSRSPTGRRSGTCRPSTAPRAASSRSTRRRFATCG